MLMKLKNKTIVGMDGLIKDADKVGGIPDRILLSPTEAVLFLKEIQTIKETIKTHVQINKRDTEKVDISLLIWGSKKLEARSAEMIIKKWYKKDYIFFYKGIELIVAKTQGIKGPSKDDSNPWVGK